jgi:hypothetical protein
MLGNLERIFNAVSVNGTGSATSDMFDFGRSTYWGIMVKLAGTTASVDSILEVCYENNSSNAVSPSGYPSIARTATSSAFVMYNITNYNMPYARIKLTGAASNGTDVTATVYICNREE